MLVRIVEEADVDDILDAAIKDTLVKCFPRNETVFSKARRWRGNKPLYNAVVFDKGIVLGNIAVVDRTIKIGQQLVRVAAVANVCVLPEHQGTGISDDILKAAMEEADRRDFPLGFLFTTESIKEVYARNGWIETKGQTVVRMENGREIIMPTDTTKMYYPLRSKEFPPGDVHLLGDKW